MSLNTQLAVLSFTLNTVFIFSLSMPLKFGLIFTVCSALFHLLFWASQREKS